MSHRNTMQHTATRHKTLQHAATRCKMLQHSANAYVSRYNTLQHAATRCNAQPMLTLIRVDRVSFQPFTKRSPSKVSARYRSRRIGARNSTIAPPRQPTVISREEGNIWIILAEALGSHGTVRAVDAIVDEPLHTYSNTYKSTHILGTRFLQ